MSMIRWMAPATIALVVWVGATNRLVQYARARESFELIYVSNATRHFLVQAFTLSVHPIQTNMSNLQLRGTQHQGRY